MIEVCVSEGAIDAVDVGMNEVRVDVAGWTPRPEGPGLNRRVDEARTGLVRGLSVPEAAVSIERLDEGRWQPFDDRAGYTELCAGGHVLKFELSVIVYAGLDDPCVIEQSGPDEFSVRFAFPALNVPGGLPKPRLPPEADFVLRGCPSAVTLDAEAFAAYLRTIEVPVVLENEFHWSTALAERMAAGATSEASA